MTFWLCLAFYVNSIKVMYNLLFVRVSHSAGKKIYAINISYYLRQLPIIILTGTYISNDFKTILYGNMCLQNRILVKISEENIYTILWLEMNLRFGSGRITDANVLCDFEGLCIPMVSGLFFCALQVFTFFLQ